MKITHKKIYKAKHDDLVPLQSNFLGFSDKYCVYEVPVFDEKSIEAKMDDLISKNHEQANEIHRLQLEINQLKSKYEGKKPKRGISRAK
jgi:hypothetical protein